MRRVLDGRGKSGKPLRRAGFEGEAILQILVPLGKEPPLQTNHGGRDRAQIVRAGGVVPVPEDGGENEPAEEAYPHAHRGVKVCRDRQELANAGHPHFREGWWVHGDFLRVGMHTRAVGKLRVAVRGGLGGLLRFRFRHRLRFRLRESEFVLILVRDLTVPFFFFVWLLYFPVPHVNASCSEFRGFNPGIKPH